MSTLLHDDVRRTALAKVARLEAARASLEALTDDECQIMYVELEGRLARDSTTTTAGTTGAPASRKSHRACGEIGHPDQILAILAENKHGLRTHEVTEKTGGTRQNTFGILTRLERRGRVVRHGSRHATLWTLPGVEPVQRVETIPAAIVDALSRAKGPMDGRRLRNEVESVLVRSTGRGPTGSSLATALGRLLEQGAIAYHGANEHGPLYILVAPKGEATAPDVN